MVNLLFKYKEMKIKKFNYFKILIILLVILTNSCELGNYDSNKINRQYSKFVKNNNSQTFYGGLIYLQAVNQYTIILIKFKDFDNSLSSNKFNFINDSNIAGIYFCPSKYNEFYSDLLKSIKKKSIVLYDSVIYSPNIYFSFVKMKCVTFNLEGKEQKLYDTLFYSEDKKKYKVYSIYPKRKVIIKDKFFHLISNPNDVFVIEKLSDIEFLNE
jgi:hypothetical protein